MRVLGLDVGDRRVGIAISDPQGLLSRGLTTLERSADAALLSELEAIVEREKIGCIVVGLPLKLNGSEGPQSQKVRSFAAKLQKRFRRRASVVLWDERLSTAGAERALLEADLSRNKRKQLIDKLAAAFILQAYLDAHRPRNPPPPG